MSEDRIDSASPAETAPPEKGPPVTGDWPLRPWLLAVILAFGGLAIHFATDQHSDQPGRMALAAFFFFGPLCAAFSLERERWKEVAAFSLAAGLVMAGLAWRAVDTGDHYADEEFGFAAGVFATLLALPLFQAGFHRLRFKTPYRDTHFFVWTDAVSGAGALAFTGLTWLLLFILGELFALLKIELLKDLLEEGWFGWTISGAAFGAALGVLRNHLKILGTLQSVVLLVLSILAVPLAGALLLFLLAMLVSGLDTLWEATRSATPILLSCAAGAFILTNAIIREDDGETTRSPIMRIAALVLALGILPLTGFAAVSMGTRISAYGLSPERLWGLVAIAVACAYGLAALVAVVRGRLAGWRDQLRRANLNLAVGVSALALLLALPIFNFGAISASNQLARLSSGAVSVDDFDFAALRWDFGDAGRRALARLAKSEDAEVAKLAKEAIEQETRPWYGREGSDNRAERLAKLRTDIADPALREALDRLIRNEGWRCEVPCTALDLGTYADGAAHLALVQNGNVEHLRLGENGTLAPHYMAEPSPARSPAPGEAGEPAEPVVEVRAYRGRQIYVDGKPAGQPFE